MKRIGLTCLVIVSLVSILAIGCGETYKDSEEYKQAEEITASLDENGWEYSVCQLESSRLWHPQEITVIVYDCLISFKKIFDPGLLLAPIGISYNYENYDDLLEKIFSDWIQWYLWAFQYINDKDHSEGNNKGLEYLWDKYPQWFDDDPNNNYCIGN